MISKNNKRKNLTQRKNLFIGGIEHIIFFGFLEKKYPRVCNKDLFCFIEYLKNLVFKSKLGYDKTDINKLLRGSLNYNNNNWIFKNSQDLFNIFTQDILNDINIIDNENKIKRKNKTNSNKELLKLIKLNDIDSVAEISYVQKKLFNTPYNLNSYILSEYLLSKLDIKRHIKTNRIHYNSANKKIEKFSNLEYDKNRENKTIYNNIFKNTSEINIITLSKDESKKLYSIVRKEEEENAKEGITKRNSLEDNLKIIYSKDKVNTYYQDNDKKETKIKEISLNNDNNSISFNYDKKNNNNKGEHNKEVTKNKKIIKLDDIKIKESKDYDNSSHTISSCNAQINNSLNDTEYNMNKNNNNDIIKTLKDKQNNDESSFSTCYTTDDHNIISKARELIKERDNEKIISTLYSNNYKSHNKNHNGNYNNKKFQLKDYIRNGEVQEGFKLAEQFLVNDTQEKDYNIKAFNTKTKQYEEVNVSHNSVYAQLDMMTNSNVEWKNYHYIDTDTGEERIGIYAEDLKEFKDEAKKVLGNKDEYGMRLNGMIVLINGIEPGEGTISLHDYKVRKGDKIEIVYKNDNARYEPLCDKDDKKLDLKNAA